MSMDELKITLGEVEKGDQITVGGKEMRVTDMTPTSGATWISVHAISAGPVPLGQTQNFTLSGNSISEITVKRENKHTALVDTMTRKYSVSPEMAKDLIRLVTATLGVEQEEQA